MASSSTRPRQRPTSPTPTKGPWRLGPQRTLVNLRQEKALPNLNGGFYRPAADGVHVASYTDHGLDLVNEKTGTVSPVRDARATSFFDPGSWRPDGRRFVQGTADGYVQVFDDAGNLRTEARVARATVTDVDYASGGQTIAVSDLTGKVALLNASTMSAAGSRCSWTDRSRA